MKKNSKILKEEQSESFSEYLSTPINKREYKKRIAKVKSKYMDDYKNSNKKSKYIEEKYFNNLLTTYYEDYNKLKNKYNFKDQTDFESNNIDIDEKEYSIKKQNMNKLFSLDLFDIQDINFDFSDNLINNLSNDNQNTLLKTTQNKEDYNFRLQGFIKNKKNIIINEEKLEDEEEDKVNIKAKNSEDLKNNTSENNINNIAINENEEKESIGYIEDNQQFKENNNNYLKLNQKNEDLPLFSDIISSNYNKNYKVPIYENNENEIIKKSKEDFKKKVENEEENKLILINDNKENMKFEDIIKSDFNKEYKIPEYKIPNNIKKEIENDEKEDKNKRIIFEENKNNNINISKENKVNDKLKEVNDLIINKKEKGEFIEDDNYKKEKNKKEESKVEHNENVKEKEKKNIDDNYSDEFEKIEVGDLQEIDNEDENNKKYNDFES